MRCYAVRPRTLQAKAERVRQPGPAALPPGLRAGAEALSGFSLADVPIHYNSKAPARIGAEAFTQDGEIHVGPGQERHLPHEAWHAVQQKQGRAGPAAQAKGAALNADPALEAEADRMGAAAARDGSEAHGPLRRAPAQAGVVQRKVKRASGALIGKSEPMSDVLRRYVESGTEYLLGKESEANLTSLPVHLLKTNRKYLLGEMHDYQGDAAGTSKWQTEVKQWPTIPKMVEHAKGIPRETDDKAGTLKEKGDPLALESRHAYLLVELLGAREQLNLLNAQFPTGMDRQSTSLIALHSDRLDDSLGEIEKSVPSYDAFAANYDPQRHGDSARLTGISRFAMQLTGAWTSVLVPMQAAVHELYRLTSRLDSGGQPHLLDPDLTTARDLMTKIGQGAATLSALAASLIDIVGFGNVAEDKAVRGFAASSQGKLPPAVDSALNLARERGMVANIDSVNPPLLVRIGDFHLKRVALAAKPPLFAIDKNNSLTQISARYDFIEYPEKE